MNFEEKYDEICLSIDKTANNVVQLLVEEKKKLSSAESCTGGLVSAAITAVSGSSDVFDLGICTYANSAKMKYLGVPAEILDTFGAVSSQTASLMAQGIRLAADSDIGLSVTGVAGPSGGTKDKPVGTVYVGLSTCDKCESKIIFTSTDNVPADKQREYIRKCTVLGVLQWVERELKDTK